ncbi:tail fiber assembly protein [Desulfovibrio sp.]|uniref:tail fiber assembly protein n=1 Tax=Desulfovibrio sp. TaxID=885 RepID=UPI0030790FA0
MNRIILHSGIVLNCDNQNDVDTMLGNGARELTAQEISAAGMIGYEHLVSPANTAVSEDGIITFTPPEPPSSESLFASFRTERDRRLAATDYLLMPDYPLDDTLKGAVQAYRQALRDLPSQEGAPWDGGGEDTPWPEIPNVLQERQGSSTSSVYTPGVM